MLTYLSLKLKGSVGSKQEQDMKGGEKSWRWLNMRCFGPLCGSVIMRRNGRGEGMKQWIQGIRLMRLSRRMSGRSSGKGLRKALEH